MDLSGNDIRSVPNVASWVDCRKLCQDEQLCLFWSIKSNGACWLKTSDSGRRSESGTTSGSKICGGMVPELPEQTPNNPNITSDFTPDVLVFFLIFFIIFQETNY